MGALTIATGDVIYLDANCIIYSGEHIAPYEALLAPVWSVAASGACTLITSELCLMEALVGPFKRADAKLVSDYHTLLTASDLRLIPISRPILERAAMLRANTPALKTPDAIHAATALVEGCSLLLTNDAGFRRVASLSVTILSDLLTP